MTKRKIKEWKEGELIRAFDLTRIADLRKFRHILITELISLNATSTN